MVADPKRADERVYEAIYSVPGGAPGYDRYFQLAQRVKRAKRPLEYLSARSDAAWGVNKALEQLSARSILEAGCGLGYLTHALIRAGYNAEGIDISESAIGWAKDAYGDFYRVRSIEQHASQSKNRYDAVVMAEVIEHLEDPIALLQSALELLKPNGALILTTPNRSYVGYKEPWGTDLPPVHLWWFSEESILAVACRIGAVASFVDFTEYNRRFPILQTYRVTPQPVLDENGAVIRKERAPLALLRKLGVLHDTYWAVSVAASFMISTKSSRRQTLVAILRRTTAVEL